MVNYKIMISSSRGIETGKVNIGALIEYGEHFSLKHLLLVAYGNNSFVILNGTLYFFTFCG